MLSNSFLKFSSVFLAKLELLLIELLDLFSSMDIEDVESLFTISKLS
jgi:hypothetical protein